MTLDELMNRILDVLLEHGGRFTSGTFGHTLIELAIEAHGEDFRIGDRRYGATSLAVIRLESYGFVEVERAYENRPGRANVIVEVALRE